MTGVGPYLPVDLTQCCMAARPEADIGPYCSIFAMEVSAHPGNKGSVTANPTRRLQICSPFQRWKVKR